MSQNSQIETVEADRCDYFNKFLAMKEGSPEFKHDAEIISFTILLCDSYSADFKLVNGDKSSGPYLDVILYDDNQEVQVLPADKQSLEGTYKFYDSYEKRELVLIIKRK